MSRFERFKNWLRHSGVKTSKKAARENEAANEPVEIIDSLNPFDFIFENPEYPLARILRKGIWTGIVDTWQILMGNHYSEKATAGRKGVLDILVFPIVARHLIEFAVNSGSSRIVNTLAAIAGGLLELARLITATALTIALSPIIVLTHIAFAIPAFLKRAKANELVVEVSAMSEDYSHTRRGDISLNQLLNEYEVKLADFEAAERELTPARKVTSPTIEQVGDDGQVVSQPKETYYKAQTSKGCGFVFFDLPRQPQEDPKQQEAMEAFKALNIGGKRG